MAWHGMAWRRIVHLYANYTTFELNDLFLSLGVQ